MMIGNPTVEIPTWNWDPVEDLTTGMASPFSPSSPSINFNGNAGVGDHFPLLESFAALHRYLPSNQSDSLAEEESDIPVDAFSCDHFRMYEFKVRRCARARSHDWTECPYAHPGEKARRRDPRKYLYSGTACPDFRKGSCGKGDLCEFAHGVFECWLHPSRYHTQPCKDGQSCRRRVCFFAHTPEQLRVLPQQSPRGHGSGDSFDGSPVRHGFDAYLTKGSFVSSPTSILTSPLVSPPSDSPPTSPSSVPLGGRSVISVSEITSSMRNIQLGKLKMSPPPWGVQIRPGFCSPRGSTLRPGFCSPPSTPTRSSTRSGLRLLDNYKFEEEPAMERVESGRDIRAQIYAKLSKENSLRGVNLAVSAPDVGWVSELLK
ncbi:hypothetical protein I3843_16G033400 [Carya illinoinensis]|nr:hypothetical protein I3843_16G033400 [Carya illinoinensis]